MPADEASKTLMVHPVLSYTTAVTSRAMCIVELRVPGLISEDAPLALRFHLGRADAAALGRALLNSAEFASRLATAPPESPNRQ